MCELLGMSFALPVSAGLTMEPFAEADVSNADGWGLAWYTDHVASLIREPIRWRESAHAEFLSGYRKLRSHLFIAHIRHATVAREPSLANTHPFLRSFGGRDYTFAHNGTVSDAMGVLPLGRFTPLGETDSEYVFCHILEILARRRGRLDTPEEWLWLHRKFRQINSYGKFNCLLSDGRRLFAYFDLGAHKGLVMRHVSIHDHDIRHLEDEQINVDLFGEDPSRGIVIASRPLSEHHWHPIFEGELLVVEDGRLIHSSARSASMTHEQETTAAG